MAANQEFENLFLHDIDTFYRVAIALCSDRNFAEDLVQTAVVKAIASFASFRSGSNFKAWFVRIIRNTWYDELRRRKIAGHKVQIDDLPLPAEDELNEEVWASDDDILEKFSDSQVIDAILSLNEDQRLALMLVDVEQLAHTDVADIMGVPVGTIKSRTSRARLALAEKLEQHAREYGFLQRRSRQES